MASKLSFLIERKKPNNKDKELAIVKAAAWAWYQHGSAHELRNTTSEFEATRTHRAPKPSRYKLETMRSMVEEVKEGSLIHNKESLLDAYEVQSISKHLDRLLESNNNKNMNKNKNKNKVVKGVDNFVNASVDVGDGRMTKKKKKISKGFLLRHGAIICGRDLDFVDPTRASKDRRLQSAKGTL